jgi:hypothetical protein
VTREKISDRSFPPAAILDGHSTARNLGVATLTYPGCQ